MRNDKSERRTARRVTYLCEVECEGASVSRLTTRINDLSVTGAFIDSMTAFPAGSNLKMRFRVGGTEVMVTAEVRYAIPNVGVGVMFIDLTDDQKAAIETLTGASS